MADNRSKKRLSRRRDQAYPIPIQNLQGAELQYYPAGDERYPVLLRPSPFGAPQSIHEPQLSGFGAAPPGPGNYDASPSLPTQLSHYDSNPPATMDPYTQNSEAHFHPQPVSTARFNGEYGQRGPSQLGSVAMLSSLGPTYLEPRQESWPHIQTEATPEGQRVTHAVSPSITLEDEYATLYKQRHEIGVRMEEIKRGLTAERCTALMAKLDPQELATLKPWSDNTGN
ncbi:hypothetical protein G6011_01496 [Alternaria panax]|uniref:Uncharacterized protein n=1 Tax=Alternaria panax TaxID=48097 RepID=A0AAD4NWG1_9PLEO|nr:hypothetical protein G6011_01496 [Alternaria panax]